MLKKNILVTGSSGFIGSFLVESLLKQGHHIIGVDNMNDYYDVSLKQERLKRLNDLNMDYDFNLIDICDKQSLEQLFINNKIDLVVHLAAQAGVRYSIDHPDIYIQSNIIGFYNMLELIRKYPVEHFIYASSSSVYGLNSEVPFSTDDKTDMPVSLYAATKKADELLAHTYSHLYDMNVTGLRFFTVYGPYGRPDMAYFSFTEKLLNNEKIKIFNYGNCERDFTYIDDIVEGINRIIEKGPINKYNLYNIGNNHPENLMVFVSTLCDCLKDNDLLQNDFVLQDYIELLPMQAGDVITTYADTTPLEKDYDFKPNTDLKDGLDKFVKWYKEYKD